MKPTFNPLDHPICFTRPLWLYHLPGWVEHVPFGMLMIDLARPKILVELGTHIGVSYCAFCQAVKQLGLDTHCYAVDTWKGDPQTTFYGPEILAELRAHHDPLYGEFSRLIQSTFDEGVNYFTDGSIDLLHIDGFHTYNAVKHDFETWLPKLSQHAVVLFHDTNVRERDFGVWKLWRELQQKYSSFEFFHGYGLGVLRVGEKSTPALQPLFTMSADQSKRTREFFFALGSHYSIQVGQDQGIKGLANQITVKEQSCQALKTQMAEREQSIRALQILTAEREQSIRALQTQAAEREQSYQALKTEAEEKEQSFQALKAEAAGVAQKALALTKQVAEHEQKTALWNDQHAKNIGAKETQIKTLEASVQNYQTENGLLLAKVQEQEAAIHSLHMQILEICSGTSWKLVQWMRRVRLFLAPAGSRGEKSWWLGIHALRVLKNEGLGVFAQKTIRKLRGREAWFPPPVPIPSNPPHLENIGEPTSVPVHPAEGQKYSAVYNGLLAVSQGRNQQDYVPLATTQVAPKDPPIKLIAFYLPQYHPIPENDEWWGKGFTDWTNVAKSVPQFIGHYQPRLPGELGYYDLRLPEVQRRQVELARQYGITGFCFYYYWFNGKRLLERPIDQFVNDPQIDFPFCLCWANENWTRRWDGQENDILIAQQHSKKSDHSFIHDIIPILRHKNYIRVNGRPLLVVYRANILPDPAGTAKRWREDCRQAGLEEPYLVAAQTFGFTDPRKVGYDAAVEFPPHNANLLGINHAVQIINPDYQGGVFRYTDIMEQRTGPDRPPFTVFKTVFPGWDNNPRKPGRGYTFAFSTPANYQHWLTQAGQFALQEADPEKRLVFINAWNEWAEGAYLEPDRRFGYAFLQAGADALRILSAGKPHGKALLNQAIHLDPSIKRHDTAVILHLFYPEMWDEIQNHLENLQGDFDLYVSIPRPVKFAAEKILGRYPQAYIHRCENRGRDVAPFLSLYAALYPLQYKYICKIHTKLSSHREDGEAWRQDLFRKLLGSPAAIQSSKAVLDRHAFVGMIVPQDHLLSSKVYWGKNAANVERLAHLVGVDFTGQEFHFAAGSMFWFRPRALYPLTLLQLGLDDFEAEQGQKDGTLAHAFERMFGLVPYSMGYKFIEISPDGTIFEPPQDSADKYEFAMTKAEDPKMSEVNRAPIIIYQMGKVGSITIKESLVKAYQNLSIEIPIHHIHVLNDLDGMDDAIRRERVNPADTLTVIEEGKRLREQIDLHPDADWKIISLVREPVGRNVGTFFHNLDEFIPDWRSREAEGNLSLEFLQKTFFEIKSIHAAPDWWFDSQLKPVFGIDVFASPFPAASGYKAYWSKPHTPVLVIRLEDLNRCAGEAMREFLNLENFEIIRANVGEEKEYANLYKAFKELPLPAEYVAKMYSTRYARHFYTPEELRRFQELWTGKAGKGPKGGFSNPTSEAKG